MLKDLEAEFERLTAVEEAEEKEKVLEQEQPHEQ